MAPPDFLRISHLLRNHAQCFRSKRCCYHSGQGVYGHRPELPNNLPKNNLDDATAIKNRNAAANFARLVEAFRAHGHRAATLNPLGDSVVKNVPEISLSRFPNLEQFLPEEIAFWKDLEGKQELPATEGVDLLQKTYATQTGFEFMHLEVRFID